MPVPVHIVLHQGRIVAVDGGRGVIQRRQKIFLDIADIGGVVLHAVHNILHMGTVQLHKPGLYHLRRIIVSGNADDFAGRTHGTDETFTKLFVLSWNEIAEHPEDYQEKWEVNIKSDDVLLRHKTRLLMKHAAADPIKEFDSALMMAVMDHITVYEDGRLQIRFFDETEFEVATE